MAEQYTHSGIDLLIDNAHADTSSPTEYDNIVNFEEYRQQEKADTLQAIGNVAITHAAKNPTSELTQNSINYPHPGNLRFQVMDEIRRRNREEWLRQFWEYHDWAKSQPPQPRIYED